MIMMMKLNKFTFYRAVSSTPLTRGMALWTGIEGNLLVMEDATSMESTSGMKSIVGMGYTMAMEPIMGRSRGWSVVHCLNLGSNLKCQLGHNKTKAHLSNWLLLDWSQIPWPGHNITGHKHGKNSQGKENPPDFLIEAGALLKLSWPIARGKMTSETCGN